MWTLRSSVYGEIPDLPVVGSIGPLSREEV